MNLHENTDFGRKVFFLYPPLSFRTSVMTSLVDNEYEVYSIDNHRYAKEILRKFPDSICFVCIDSHLSKGEWFNFLRSFEKDPLLSTIFFGIITEHHSKRVRDLFQMNTTIPAGFIELTESHDDLTEIFKGILEINGAKGRRKYVRVDCETDPSMSVAFKFESRRLNMHIRDISSVGFSITCPEELAELFRINLLIRDFSITVNTKMHTCSAAVVMSTVRDNKSIIVLIFTRTVSAQLKKDIRKYIGINLQNKITNLLLSCTLDETDYTKEVASEDSADATTAAELAKAGAELQLSDEAEDLEPIEEETSTQDE